MQNDPLANFRRSQPTANNPLTQTAQDDMKAKTATAPKPDAADDELNPPPPKFDPKGQEIYQAYRVSMRKCDRLEIRCKNGVWQYPRYFDLRDMSADARQGTQITLHFPLYDIFIEGRNLQHCIYALRQSRCDYIQEFKAENFSPENPEGQTAAFIQSIAIMVKQPAPQQAPKVNEKGNTVN